MVKTSPQFEMNKTDWQKAAKSAVVYFAPVLLIYVSGVLGVLQFEGHHFSPKDLIPSQLVIDGSIIWGMMQIQGILIRWSGTEEKK